MYEKKITVRRPKPTLSILGMSRKRSSDRRDLCTCSYIGIAHTQNAKILTKSINVFATFMYTSLFSLK